MMKIIRFYPIFSAGGPGPHRPVRQDPAAVQRPEEAPAGPEGDAVQEAQEEKDEEIKEEVKAAAAAE